MADDFVTMTQAREILWVSKDKLRALVREHRLETFDNPRDKRERLVRRADVEQLLQPVSAAVKHNDRPS